MTSDTIIRGTILTVAACGAVWAAVQVGKAVSPAFKAKADGFVAQVRQKADDLAALTEDRAQMAVVKPEVFRP